MYIIIFSFSVFQLNTKDFFYLARIYFGFKVVHVIAFVKNSKIVLYIIGQTLNLGLSTKVRTLISSEVHVLMFD